MDQQSVSLANLAAGAAVELFDEELRKALANILDPNTEAESTRTITLKVTIKPNDLREMGAVAIEATSKLAPYKGTGTQIYIGSKGNDPVAFEWNPKQTSLFQPEQTKPVAVDGGRS